MNVLQSLVPSTSRPPDVACYCTIEVFKKICVNAKHSQSTEDNYETNFLKIGLLWLWVGGLGG